MVGTRTTASILVVDDDEDLRSFVQTILEGQGFRVRAVDSAEAALAALTEEVPSLVLLDVLMPGTDGIELARKLRSIDGLHSLPIAFLTSMGDGGTQERAAAAGGNDFLTKPFSPTELVSRVRALISVTELHAEVERCYRDMTLQVAALSRARQHQKTLTELLAHDMKNPVTAILLGVEHALATLDTSPESARESLSNVKLGASQLQTMLSDLLDVELAEERGLSATKTEVNIAQLLSEIVELFRPRAEEVGLALTLDTAGDVGSAMLDKSLIVRTLSNLVDNALRYAPKGSDVTVRACVRSEMIVVEVVDHGLGIPSKMRELVFEKYSRGGGADPVRQQRGLGLSFCRLATRAHGGDVLIDDVPGGGTCFRVTLPAGVA